MDSYLVLLGIGPRMTLKYFQVLSCTFYLLIQMGSYLILLGTRPRMTLKSDQHPAVWGSVFTETLAFSSAS